MREWVTSIERGQEGRNQVDSRVWACEVVGLGIAEAYGWLREGVNVRIIEGARELIGLSLMGRVNCKCLVDDKVRIHRSRRVKADE